MTLKFERQFYGKIYHESTFLKRVSFKQHEQLQTSLSS